MTLRDHIRLTVSDMAMSLGSWMYSMGTQRRLKDWGMALVRLADRLRA